MSQSSDHRLGLPPGQLLHGKYKIESILGSGGFAITYRALDTTLDRYVAIKELLPNDFATRGSDSVVVAKTKADGASLDWALKRFMEEARVLARFDHPNIVRIIEYFQANQTAYMVMTFEEGEDFNRHLKKTGLLNGPRCQALLSSLLDGLKEVHAANILHRDIKPGNLYIAQGARPVLLDFGSARLTIGAKTKDITTIVTPKYAPFEQYHTTGNLGPWTDIYSLAAVIHKGITGRPPPEAPKRERNDPYEPLADRIPYLPSPFLKAIDWALAPVETNRPQSIEEWSEVLLPALDVDSPSDYEPPTVPLREREEVSSATLETRAVTTRTSPNEPRTVYSEGIPTATTSTTTQANSGNRLAIPIFLTSLALGSVGLGIYYFDQSKEPKVAESSRPEKEDTAPVKPPQVTPPSNDNNPPIKVPPVKPAPDPPVTQDPPPQQKPKLDPEVQRAIAKGAVNDMYGNVFDFWQLEWRQSMARQSLDSFPSSMKAPERDDLRKRRVVQIKEYGVQKRGHYENAREAAKTLVQQSVSEDIVDTAFDERKATIEQRGREMARKMTNQVRLLDIARDFYAAEVSGAFFEEEDLSRQAIEVDPNAK